MNRCLRVLMVVVLALPILPSVGCNSKDESKPNPDLQVPDVPPSGSSSGGKKGPTSSPTAPK